MDILQRITQLKRQRNWNDYRLSVESGIPQTTISSWYKKSTPHSFFPTKNLRRFWGFYGSILYQNPKNSRLNPCTKELLKNWGDLSHANRDLVLLIIDWMKRNLK